MSYFNERHALNLISPVDSVAIVVVQHFLGTFQIANGSNTSGSDRRRNPEPIYNG